MANFTQTPAAAPASQNANSPPPTITYQATTYSTTDQSTGIITPPPSPEPTAKVQEIAKSIEAFMALLPILTEFPEAIKNPHTIPDDVVILGQLLTEGLNYFADLVDWEVVSEGFEGGEIEWGGENEM